MIDADVRKAIYQLHLAGTPLHDISRQFRVSRNCVRRIIREQGAMPHTVRKDKIQIDPELLRRLYRECQGWIQRMHEKLVEEEKIQVSYPTLTRLVRELGLGRTSSARCDHVPDEPGAEMQHDTTVYRVKLAGQWIRLVASLLYLRYSKRRYLRFYRMFNRFAMKCFFHEALLYWGYAAALCIIDNTNLARLRGSGKRAVTASRMRGSVPRGNRPRGTSLDATGKVLNWKRNDCVPWGRKSRLVYGVVPAWLILATAKPVPYGIGWMAIVMCLTYCLERSRYADMGIGLMSAVTETVSVVVSLLVVRSCGYRLVRLPKSMPRGSRLDEFTLPHINDEDSQSSSLSL